MPTSLGDYFDRTWHLNVGVIAACPFLESRGTPLRVDGLATALGNLGHEVHVCTYHLGETPEDRPYSIGRTNSLPFYGKTDPGPDLRKPLVDLLLLQKALRDFKEFEPDLLIGSHVEGGFIGSMLKNKFGVPLIYDAHGSFAEEMAAFHWIPDLNFLRRPFDAIEDYIVRHSDAVGCVSRKLEVTLAERSSHSVPTTFLPNGVNIEDHENIDSKREELAVDDSGFLVAYAGNLTDYQGVDDLLEAIQMLDDPDVHLLVVGGPPQDLQETARDLGILDKVTFVGQVPSGEIPAYLAGADCLVAPRIGSDTESQQASKLMDYLASGKAIVATDVSAHDVLEDAETALLVPDRSPGALAGAIDKLIEDENLRERLGANARDRARDFEWSRAGEKIIDLYRRVTNDQVLSVQGST